MTDDGLLLPEAQDPWGLTLCTPQILLLSCPAWNDSARFYEIEVDSGILMLRKNFMRQG